jgi:hypothetical protein
MQIEMAKSELLPAIHISSAAIARHCIQLHRAARLTLPIDTRHCDSITAPNGVIVMERLFRGLLACVTEQKYLHIWDIRYPDAKKFPTISEPKLIDVMVELDYNLLVLLCYDEGSVSHHIFNYTSRIALYPGTRPQRSSF